MNYRKDKITSEQALDEFKVAVQIWFSHMDDTTRRQALVYASSKLGTPCIEIKGEAP